MQILWPTLPDSSPAPAIFTLTRATMRAGCDQGCGPDAAMTAGGGRWPPRYNCKPGLRA
jgi:hypothetical protein